MDGCRLVAYSGHTGLVDGLPVAFAQPGWCLPRQHDAQLIAHLRDARVVDPVWRIFGSVDVWSKKVRAAIQRHQQLLGQRFQGCASVVSSERFQRHAEAHGLNAVQHFILAVDAELSTILRDGAYPSGKCQVIDGGAGFVP